MPINPDDHVCDILRQIGEFANDYIEVRRDYTDWMPLGDPRSEQATEVPTTEIYPNGDKDGQPDLQPNVHHNGTEEPHLEPIPEKFGDGVIPEVIEAP